MFRNAMSRRFAMWVAAGAVCVSLAGLLPVREAPAANVVAAAPVPAGTARIWFYRDYEPYGSRNFATVRLNGAVAGYAGPQGTVFYRDVAPGHYRIAVDSRTTNEHEAGEIDLASGQQVFVKILASNTWETGGDKAVYSADAFYVSLIPPQVAAGEIAANPRSGG